VNLRLEKCNEMAQHVMIIIANGLNDYLNAIFTAYMTTNLEGNKICI
jgi:hypothetical protein